MENDKIAKRVYIGECAGSHSACQPRKEEVDCYREGLLKKRESERGLDIKQGEWRMIGVNDGGLCGRMYGA